MMGYTWFIIWVHQVKVGIQYLMRQKLSLELISDVGMCLYLEKGIWGRVSYIFKRYSKANNKYLKYYDPKQELKHCILRCE